jgi:hypothetical protein
MNGTKALTIVVIYHPVRSAAVFLINSAHNSAHGERGAFWGSHPLRVNRLFFFLKENN